MQQLVLADELHNFQGCLGMVENTMNIDGGLSGTDANAS
jgi:hypothetical protein